MSSVSKGNKFELEARNTLEADGWKVFRQHRKPIFMKGKMITIGADIFGSDLVCKKNGYKPLWVQVSTLENLSSKKQQMLEHPINLDFERYEIWIRVQGKKEFRVFRLIEEETLNGRDTKFKEVLPFKIKERPSVK